MKRNYPVLLSTVIRGRIRFASVALAALLLAALAHPTLAAPVGAGDPPATAPAAAYTLHGDTANSGTSSTNFITSHGSSSIPTWLFGSTSLNSGTRTLRSFCQANNCIGAEGEGKGRGVNGIGIGDAAVGVYGTHDSIGGTTAGVRGSTHSTADGARAIEGVVDSYGDPGANSVAVIGINPSTNSLGIGVWGTQYGTGWGVYGAVTGAGRGVFGESAGTGVYGVSSGTGTSARGVYGTVSNGQGVRGYSGLGTGVVGASTSGTGGSFSSSSGDALHASTSNIGGYAISTSGSGIFGSGDVYIGGDLTVTGACCAVVATDAGARRMYAVEATRHTFSDEGTATLVNGVATITLDPLFTQAANLSTDYQVFLTSHSADTPGLAAVRLTATGFEVRELKGGSGGNFAFSWRVDAVRKGYEQVRMEAAPAAPAAATSDVAAQPDDEPQFGPQK